MSCGGGGPGGEKPAVLRLSIGMTSVLRGPILVLRLARHSGCTLVQLAMPFVERERHGATHPSSSSHDTVIRIMC